ncbi:MAG: hypothetical protein WC268_04505 [Patescibacteria group bacterium]|jgi:hypothetical protein
MATAKQATIKSAIEEIELRLRQLKETTARMAEIEERLKNQGQRWLEKVKPHLLASSKPVTIPHDLILPCGCFTGGTTKAKGQKITLRVEGDNRCLVHSSCGKTIAESEK